MDMAHSRSTCDSEDSTGDLSVATALISRPQHDAKVMKALSEECLINKDTSNELRCQAYKYCWWKVILTTVGVICSGGFLMLIFYWRPDWKLLCTCSKTNWDSAVKVFLTTTDETEQAFVSSITKMPLELASLIATHYPNPNNNIVNAELSKYGSNDDEGFVICFVHHLSKYVWSRKHQTFVELSGLSGQATLDQLYHNAAEGLSPVDVTAREEFFGSNVITVEIPSYLRLMLSEILNPFYIFQLFAVLFWMFDQYITYATAILIISIISAVTSLIQIRRERVRLHNMVEYHNEIKTTVLRLIDGELKQIQLWSKDLVPGDVIVVPSHGMQMPCDAVLVSGTCIVNESMLTGESVPVTKTTLPSSPSEISSVYDTETYKRHSLFCGTEILQTRFYRGELVKAVVVQTGYHTAKGRLVHSILFPKPVDMKLLQDAYRFVALLFCMAMAGFIYTVVMMHFAGESARDIAFNAIDLITISVPPALPLAMTIGIVYAQLRLQKQKIHCISPQRINITGQVDVVAFDKTGTLTEDGLDLYAVVPVNHDPSRGEAGDRKFISPLLPSHLADTDVDDKLLQCMVTCHTLTTIDGNLTGDPLDVKMFEATGWNMIEPSVEDEAKYDRMQSTYMRPPLSIIEKESERFDRDELVGSMEMLDDNAPPEGPIATQLVETSMYDLGIVRQFPFSSSLQRCSVIVKPYKSDPKDLLVFVKGAPETVAKLCLHETLPPDFHEVLKSYTQRGLRMIGLAYRPLSCSWLKAQKLERQAVEQQLVFVGLIALENKLKPQSARSLRKLHDANIRTLMVTGDNLLTSLSVARDSGMIRSDDVILVADATPPTSTAPATLTWTASDLPSDNKTTASSFSSMEEKSVSNGRTISICMGEHQIPQCWHLAVSGPCLSVIQDHFPQWMDLLAAKGTVFARMSPAQKTVLIEALQDIDYHVCMCGDGANDCGALKRAHAGLSLSEYEASVAAPFTSHTDLGIECVPTLIREGRAALVTSFGMFKFMALYSIVQFTTVTILYNKLSNLGDYQYLYIDLIVIDLIAITMSRNHAHKVLDKHKPPNNLVSMEVLVSLIFQVILQCVVQVLVYLLLLEQCWYTDLTPHQAANQTYGNNVTCPALDNVPDQSHIEDEFNILTYSDAILFPFSSLLYMSISVAFSRGRPFRTPIYNNYLFLISLIFLLAFNVFLFFAPQELNDFLLIRTIPDINFNFIALGIAGGHFLVAVFFEMFIVEQHSIWETLRRRCSCFYRNHMSKRYKVILRQLDVTRGDASFDHVVESGQSEIVNPFSNLNKPIVSRVNGKIDNSQVKTRL